MTLRDALAHAIDALRSRDVDGDATLRQAAKKLEDKLSRMRAGEEPKMGFLIRCECGERRRPKMLVCDDCYHVVPARLFMDLHLGDKSERKKAWREIRIICATRTSVEAHAA